jgi:hypothetical protein
MATIWVSGLACQGQTVMVPAWLARPVLPTLSNSDVVRTEVEITLDEKFHCLGGADKVTVSLPGLELNKRAVAEMKKGGEFELTRPIVKVPKKASAESFIAKLKARSAAQPQDGEGDGDEKAQATAEEKKQKKLLMLAHKNALHLLK